MPVTDISSSGKVKVRHTGPLKCCVSIVSLQFTWLSHCISTLGRLPWQRNAVALATQCLHY